MRRRDGGSWASSLRCEEREVTQRVRPKKGKCTQTTNNSGRVPAPAKMPAEYKPPKPLAPAHGGHRLQGAGQWASSAGRPLFRGPPILAFPPVVLTWQPPPNTTQHHTALTPPPASRSPGPKTRINTRLHLFSPICTSGSFRLDLGLPHRMALK